MRLKFIDFIDSITLRSDFSLLVYVVKKILPLFGFGALGIFTEPISG
jgi:hypothetical protein